MERSAGGEKFHPLNAAREVDAGDAVIDKDVVPAASAGGFGQEMRGGDGKGFLFASQMPSKGVVLAVIVWSDADDEFVSRSVIPGELNGFRHAERDIREAEAAASGVAHAVQEVDAEVSAEAHSFL